MPLRRLGLAVVLVGLFSVPAYAADPPAIYAVIIANNYALDKNVPPLRYADDDAVRYYELFSVYADDTALFAVLDPETQRQHRGMAEVAHPPRRAAIEQYVKKVFTQIEQHKAEGRDSIFYFIYSGHGDITDNRQGYVNLLDAKFTRADLYRSIIAPSPATYNHVIIDSCNSYFMVNARGWKNDRVEVKSRDAMSAYVGIENLDRYPNTGVVLSTSTAKETHEWSGYAAGVFSHQLRSGMVGTADVNLDGKIEYSEIRAYVAAANAQVDDPKARVELYAKPPKQNLSAPLFDTGRMINQAFLNIQAQQTGHLYLEDARGVRYADFNKSPELPVRIALLDQDYYFLRSDILEVEIRPEHHKSIEIEPSAWKPQALAGRGSTAEAFRQRLYKVAFGPSFYEGYVASHAELLPVKHFVAATSLQVPALNTSTQVVAPLSSRWWLWGAIGVIATGTAIYFGVQAAQPNAILPTGTLGTIDLRLSQD